MGTILIVVVLFVLSSAAVVIGDMLPRVAILERAYTLSA